MILVDVKVPCINSTFDFMLDENQQISIITQEICEIISKHIKNEKMGRVELFRLYRKDIKKQLLENKTLYQSGVKDGSTLLLL